MATTQVLSTEYIVACVLIIFFPALLVGIRPFSSPSLIPALFLRLDNLQERYCMVV